MDDSEGFTRSVETYLITRPYAKHKEDTPEISKINPKTDNLESILINADFFLTGTSYKSR